MRLITVPTKRGLAMLGALLVATACGPEVAPTAPETALTGQADHVPQQFGHIDVCKVGGSGSFVVAPAGIVDGTINNAAFSLNDGECADDVVTVDLVPGVSTIVQVSITETPGPGSQLDRIEVVETFIGGSNTFAINNGDVVTAGDDGGVVVTFFNVPEPPSGNEGCTPGYYKNLKKHQGAWDDAGLSPDQSVGSVFGSAAAAPYTHLGNATLHEGLKFKGGNSVEEKAEILLRAAIAAVLNASNFNVAYPISAATVIADVNAALDGGDKDSIISLATYLDSLNNGGCPI